MAATGPRTVAAILVSAGSGTRLGAEVPKAFVEVAGRSLLAHAAARVGAHPLVSSVVVVAPSTHLAAAADVTGLPVVAGGATRQESVSAGLAASDPEADYVLVHDAARPFAPDALITAVVAALRAGADAAVPVVPIRDTVRRVDASGAFVETMDRSRLVAIQTPQGFARAVLVRAHAAGVGTDASDDATLVEAIGGTVVAVAGDDAAFKITTPGDLARAHAYVSAAEDLAT